MGMWSRLKRTFRGRRHSAEIREELQFHLDMEASGGATTREARLRLGNLARITEETRAVGLLEWLDSALRDARYGCRQLAKTPALLLTIVLSLSIGVGANTAIFSLLDAAILRPLPVPQPENLRIVEWINDAFPQGVSNINGSSSPTADGKLQASSISANLYRNLAREQTAFASLLGVADLDRAAIAANSSPAQQLGLQYVSSNFFQGLGVSPSLGRPFLPAEDSLSHAPVVIVSHRFWLSQLAGSQAALASKIRINNVLATIVGVAPPGFFGLRAGQWTDVYAPLALRVAFERHPGEKLLGEDDRDWWVRPIARLKPGVPEPAARTQLASQFRSLVARDSIETARNKIPELITLPGERGFGALLAADARALWLLMLLVGVLLLIVCVNVANLLLSRSVGKQRESAVRLALGAARARLFRQHLIESGILAALGSAAGLAFGYPLARFIHLLFQGDRDASSQYDLHLDPRIMAYTVALAALTAFLFGLAPAMRAARADVNDALKASTRSVSGNRLRLPRLLVSVQVALCFTALVAAGLLTRSLQNLRWVDVGFDRENLAYATVNPWQAGYDAARVTAYIDRLRQSLMRVPGMKRVGVVEVRLLSGSGNMAGISIPGRIGSKEAGSLNRVGDGLLETLGIPLLAGRTIEPRDIYSNQQVAVVDELFAKRFFPNQDVLGRRFGFTPLENTRYQIVGVVGASRYNSLRNDAIPSVYQPYVPGEIIRPIHFALRASLDSGLLSTAARNAVASIDRAVPLTEFYTQTALIDRLLGTERLLAFLSSAFGFVALTLAAVGIGGLLSYALARRTNEFGIRIAVGATRGDVTRLVLADSFRMVGVGILLGLPFAYAVAKILASSLYRLPPLDGKTAILALAALLATAGLAAWLPARRAARIEPMMALREE